MKQLFLIVLLLTVVASAPLSAAEDPVLAKIGDRKITLSDFNRISGYYTGEKQQILSEKPGYRVTLLQRLVQGYVISAIAREKGFDRRPDIREQVEMIVNDFLAAEYIKKEVISRIRISDDDLALYYKTHQDEFKTEPMVRARHILVRVEKGASEETKKSAMEKANDILRRARAGEDFAQLAKATSEDRGSKEKGGDLGFFGRGKTAAPFDKAVFALTPGEISDIVTTQFGFHIIKVEEKKEETVEPFDKVKDKVKEKVLAGRTQGEIEAFTEKAKNDAGVEVNLAPLKEK